MKYSESEIKFIQSIMNRNYTALDNELKSDPNLIYKEFTIEEETYVFNPQYFISIRWPWGLKIALKYVSDIDMYNDKGKTALHYAIWLGDLFDAKQVLGKNASITKPDLETERTPLHYAAKHRCRDVVDLLIEKAEQDEDINLAEYVNSQTKIGETALHFASDMRDEYVVDLLLSKNATVNPVRLGGIIPLHNATSHCELFPVVKKMVDAGADVNRGSGDAKITPLCFASKANCINTSKYLIKHGANVNHQTDTAQTPLHYAAFHGSTELIILLLKSGARANVSDIEGVFPVHAAAAANSPKILSYLMAHRADVEVVHRGGQTPLMLSLEIGAIDSAQFLFDNGANLYYTKSQDGMGIGHVAAFGGNVDSINYVQDKDRSLIFALDNNMGTAMHYAAAAQDKEKPMMHLHNLGLNYCIRDKMGFTPLHIATLHDNFFAVRILSKFCDPNQKTFLGLNSYQIAHYADANKVIKFFDENPEVEKGTASIASYPYYWFTKHLGHLICNEYKANDPFVDKLAIKYAPLGTAAIQSGKNYFSKFCKNYAIDSLKFAQVVSITSDECSKYGLEKTTSINDYYGSEINVCSYYGGASSEFPGIIKVIIGTASAHLIGKGIKYVYSFAKDYCLEWYNFIKETTPRVKAFHASFNNALHPDSVSGFFSTFTPKLIFDVTKYIKWLIWKDNLSDVQKFIKEVSDKSENYFYLAQTPASCAEKDNAAFRMENNDKVNIICESDHYIPFRHYLSTTMDIVIIAVPMFKALSSCYEAYKTGHVTKSASCIGVLLVASVTILENFFTEFFTVNNDKSLSQYYANDYIDQNSYNKALYLAQKPSECVEGDKLVTQPLSLLGGDWSVCEQVDVQ